jgi:hypothetical protein
MSVVIGQTKERSLVGAHRALSCRKKLKLLFWPDRHGEHGNVLSELFLFSKNHWLKQFEAKNWRVEVLAPAGLFYTGNQILHRHLPAYLRYVVSTIMGSSSWIFKLRRNM